MTKVTVSGVLDQIENPDVPLDTVQEYLTLDDSRSKAFDPAVKIDLPKLGFTGLDTLHPTAELVRVAFVTRRQREYKRRIDAGWTGLKFVSEGDSWFQYPLALNDVITWLSGSYAIFDFASAGDTLSNMKLGLTVLMDAIAQEKSDGFLLSGGGNDLLDRGNLRMLLRPYNSKYTSAAEYIIAHRLEEKIGDLNDLRQGGILSDYNDFFKAITNKLPQLFVFCHGYDWMFSHFGGTYLYPVMEEREIPEQFRAGILKILVDKFNEKLEILASRYGQVVYVNCRGSVGPKINWFDEIHPRTPGFGRVAKRFQDKIEEAFAPSV